MDSSSLYRLVLSNQDYPPLMRESSWTLASPYKEQPYHRTLCDSIANNYSPRAKHLSIRLLTKRPFCNTEAIVPFKPKNKPTKQSKEQGVKEVISRKRCHTDEGSSKNKSSDSRLSDSKSLDSRLSDSKSESRPMSPLEQKLFVAHLQNDDTFPEVEGKELEQYLYYVQNGIADKHLAPQPVDVLEHVKQKQSKKLRMCRSFDKILEDISHEVEEGYCLYLKEAIVDYILLDEGEKLRLKIPKVPNRFKSCVIRAPVPWHESYATAVSALKHQLFISSPTMFHLKQLWKERFESFDFLQLNTLHQLPLSPMELNVVLTKQCKEGREELINKWVPACAQVLIDRKDDWANLVHSNASLFRVERFYSTVAALMSLQLRLAVMKSLKNWISFIKLYKDGNDFTGNYHDLMFLQPCLLLLKVSVQGNSVQCVPNLAQCQDFLANVVDEIAHANQNIPKIEKILFPEMRESQMYLCSVLTDDDSMQAALKETAKIFQKNTVGAEKYLKRYDEFNGLLDGSVERHVTSLLKKNPALLIFREELLKLEQIKQSITVHCNTVPLGLMCLDCSPIKEEICSRVQNLIQKVIDFKVNENKEENRR
ncbi:dynein axonemal heavy chain 3-like [Tachypleus tridentatus]|uniref:dynein axonemal heavy chain 3-like n=1 Tax=Tachypleus tridentatus TaxID=6853 RepID=UPI003FD0E411